MRKNNIPIKTGEISLSGIDPGKELRKYAVIVAGGSGLRMGADIPKQFIVVAGKPVLMHTLEKFHAYDPDMAIILVLPGNEIPYWDELCRIYDFDIPHKVTTGGTERFYSVKNGLNQIDGDGIVFIHDGVRPLVSHETLRRCFETALLHGNALPVVPVSESVRYVEEGAGRPVDREKIFLVQTPQTFRVSLIRNVYRPSLSAKFTDDASVLENAGATIQLTEGNRENIKITWPEDLLWAGALLNSPSGPKA